METLKGGKTEMMTKSDIFEMICYTYLDCDYTCPHYASCCKSTHNYCTCVKMVIIALESLERGLY